MKTLSIIVPVYFNENSLPLLFKELIKVEKELLILEVKLELIFVDDGSGDDSYAELKKIKEKRADTVIIKLTRNFGAINAVKSAIDYCTGDCLLFLAADLQDPPELIPRMVKKWTEGNKYVIATRENRHDPLTSKIFAKIYYKLLQKFVISEYPKKGFDLALMDKDIIPYLKKVGKHVNFPLFPYWLGFKRAEIKYTRKVREHGKSKWTFFKKIKLMFDSILGFNYMPVRAITLIGLLVSFLSILYAIVVMISALIGNIPVPGFATLIMITSFLLSLIIVMLGMIGEYIWRIFDEVHNNPGAVIEEVL